MSSAGPHTLPTRAETAASSIPLPAANERDTPTPNGGADPAKDARMHTTGLGWWS